MGKIVGIALLLTAFWVGSELSTHGTEGAFGGIFAAEDPIRDLRSTPQRLGDKARNSILAGENRLERMLEE